MREFCAWVAGLLFGIGLLVSGMADPAKVQAFLDIGGAWDPSLAWVMAGAVSITALGFQAARHRQQSWLGWPMQWPTRQELDRPLLVGSLLFGCGWGLVGYCPGPALVSISLNGSALLFVLAMLAGMGLFEWLAARQAR